MFIERNVFHLKFGESRRALDMWNGFLNAAAPQAKELHARLLTDLTGRSYTIILELMHERYADLEPSRCQLTQLPGWKEFYQGFIPLCVSSERTLYKCEVDFR